MKKVIDIPQKSDMGSGFGHYEGVKGMPLGKILKWIKKNTKTWGIITIYGKDNKIIRKFDYELFNYDHFYCELIWERILKVASVKFSYCFMKEDIEIYLQ